MPCRDNWDDEPATRTYNGLTGEELEAVLCGIMTVLEDAITFGNAPLATGPSQMS
jgi:hypothetical protein